MYYFSPKSSKTMIVKPKVCFLALIHTSKPKTIFDLMTYHFWRFWLNNGMYILESHPVKWDTLYTVWWGKKGTQQWTIVLKQCTFEKFEPASDFWWPKKSICWCFEDMNMILCCCCRNLCALCMHCTHIFYIMNTYVFSTRWQKTSDAYNNIALRCFKNEIIVQ